jgi:nucleoside-diphosphate-sugar epimerase
MNTLFIFGLGYSATHFARSALQKGWRVIGTCRNTDNAKALSELGIEVILFDGLSALPDFKERLKDVTHILHSIAPDPESGDCVLNFHQEDLESLSKLSWMGYLSTTGVYGNWDGALVDETHECRPKNKRSIVRKQAEDQWLNSELPIHVFRLAGIYGPKRSLFDQIKKGRIKTISKPGHVFSRIHIDDIRGVLWASITKPNPKAVYNLCDDEACEPLKVAEAAYEMLGQTPPPVQTFAEAAKSMSPMALSFWQDNKRVDNTRIKKELGYQLIHPGYREGLRSILLEETS